MPMDLLRVESNERVDLGDFQFVSDSVLEHQRQVVEQFLTDPARTRKWVISGFAMDNPAAKQLRVTKGKAIFAQRENGSVRYGLLTTEGDATKTIDLNSYAAGLYGIYVRFEFIPSDQQSRLFWDPAGSGSEFSQVIETRQQAGWSMRVESSSPGDEWLKIGEVSQASMSISDQRDFFFEGELSGTWQSGWSSDGGGSANDRNSDRSTYGITDLQMFTAAMRQCIGDIKGRGLREWFERDIGGMNIGFDANPVEDRLAVGDANFNLDHDGTDVFVNFDTNDYLWFDRSEDKLILAIGGTDELFWSATEVYPGADVGTVLGQTDKRFNGLFLGNDLHHRNTAAPADEERWKVQVDSSGSWKLVAFSDDELSSTTALEFTRDAHQTENVTIRSNKAGGTIDLVSLGGVDLLAANIGLGGANTVASSIECFQNVIPNGTRSIGVTGTPWGSMYGTALRVSSSYTTDPADGAGIFGRGLAVNVDAAPGLAEILLGATTMKISKLSDAIRIQAAASDYMQLDAGSSHDLEIVLNSLSSYTFETTGLYPEQSGLYCGSGGKPWDLIYGNSIFAYSGNLNVRSTAIPAVRYNVNDSSYWRTYASGNDFYIDRTNSVWTSPKNIFKIEMSDEDTVDYTELYGEIGLEEVTTITSWTKSYTKSIDTTADQDQRGWLKIRVGGSTHILLPYWHLADITEV